MNNGDPLGKKSYSFAIDIVKLARHLQTNEREYVLSRQVLRSGTAIGALIREGQCGQSRADFANKMAIALKEANETEYWLCLLKDSDLISEEQYSRLHPVCCELIAMLVATVKTAKRSRK